MQLLRSCSYTSVLFEFAHWYIYEHMSQILVFFLLSCWSMLSGHAPIIHLLRKRDVQLVFSYRSQKLINMKDYDKKLYENVEDLMF